MNRIDRLTAIIIYLQGRKQVSVQELSERYDVTTRTVYRDLAALQEAGVPLASEPGAGYSIVKGYHLPPVMFNREEAAALLAGERLMQRWNETEPGRSYRSALDKIRAILPQHDRSWLNTLDSHMLAIHYKSDAGSGSDDRIFPFLRNAIVNKELIDIEYHTPYKNEHTVRLVEPLGLILMSGNWYLASWCRLRRDYRMFRTDRFSSYRLAGEKLSEPPDHTIQEFYEKELHNQKELTKIVIAFSQSVVRYIGDQKYWHGWTQEKQTDSGVEMTFLNSECEYFCRWLLTWGNGATIIRPASVANRVKKLAEELYRHHQ